MKTDPKNYILHLTVEEFIDVLKDNIPAMGAAPAAAENQEEDGPTFKGRKIVAFPDIDGYDEWERKLADYPELAVTLSPILQQNATKADREAHIDIADWLIRYLFDAAPEDAWKRNAEFLKAVEFIAPENQEQVGRLIQELDLVFLGAEMIEPP